MRTYSAQEIVDTVYLAFGPLGLPRSSSPDALQCLYAGPNGTGCAVGVLLPRDVAAYMDSIGAGSITTFVDRFTRQENRWDDEVLAPVVEALRPHVDLLRDLQQIHDGIRRPLALRALGLPCGSSEEIAEGVRVVASEHGLLDPAREENAGDVDGRLAALLGDAFRSTHDNLVPA